MKRRHFLQSSAAPASLGLFASTKTPEAAANNTVRITKDIPLTRAYDIVVCGSGPAGLAAAIAAARSGKSVLLVESRGQLGGTGTSGMVSHWLGGRLSNGSKWVVGGVFRSLSKKAADQGIALIPDNNTGSRYQPHGWNRGQLGVGIPFDPFEMAAFLDGEIASLGIEAFLDTAAIDVVRDGGTISHVIVNNKSGIAAVPAKMVIDATGDADISSFAGCDVRIGRDEDHLMTPATLMFHVDNVDQDTLAKYIEEHRSSRFRELIKEMRAEGVWDFPYDIFISVQMTEKGTMMINTPRLTGIDGLNGVSVSEGYRQGRHEIMELLGIMRKKIPGFSKVRLKAIAPMLGIRETRRIMGEYTLTVEDLVAGKDFDGTIGWSSYGWDLPDPKRPSYQPMSEKKVDKRPVTPIPYNIMVPSGVDNLITPGRSVSCERDVLGPLRVSAPCFAMGEAAGQAASMAIDKKYPFKAVDVQKLRSGLEKEGAVIRWDGE